MRICVLSNSHAASLKLGYEALPPGERHALEPTFFASRSWRLLALEPAGGRLICGDPAVRRDLAFTSGGLTEVDPAAYDAFLLHAMAFRYEYEPFGARFYSQAFVTAWVGGMWEASLCRILLGRLQAITGKPIFLSPQPFRSAGDQALVEGVGASPTARPPMAELVAATGILGARASFLPQPPGTVSGDLFTAPRFSRGSTRLDVGDAMSGRPHPADDHAHMNGEYGREVWRALQERVATTRASGRLRARGAAVEQGAEAERTAA